MPNFLRKTRTVLTALFKKIQARDPRVFPAWEVLRITTIEGARAVGLGDEVGSLEPGTQADMTELNLSPVLLHPIRNLVPHLVYAGSGHEVKAVMVGGKVLVRDGEVLVTDEAALQAEAQVQAEEVARRVASDPVYRGMALLEAMRAGQL